MSIVNIGRRSIISSRSLATLDSLILNFNIRPDRNYLNFADIKELLRQIDELTLDDFKTAADNEYLKIKLIIYHNNIRISNVFDYRLCLIIVNECEYDQALNVYNFCHMAINMIYKNTNEAVYQKVLKYIFIDELVVSAFVLEIICNIFYKKQEDFRHGENPVEKINLDHSDTFLKNQKTIAKLLDDDFVISKLLSSDNNTYGRILTTFLHVMLKNDIFKLNLLIHQELIYHIFTQLYSERYIKSFLTYDNLSSDIYLINDIIKGWIYLECLKFMTKYDFIQIEYKNLMSDYLMINIYKNIVFEIRRPIFGNLPAQKNGRFANVKKDISYYQILQNKKIIDIKNESISLFSMCFAVILRENIGCLTKIVSPIILKTINVQMYVKI